jgi:hypothetical protein
MTQRHLATQCLIHSVLTIPPDPATEAWDLVLSRTFYNPSYYPFPLLTHSYTQF